MARGSLCDPSFVYVDLGDGVEWVGEGAGSIAGGGKQIKANEIHTQFFSSMKK